MLRSDLSKKVADRYKVERLTRAIVTSRWLFAKKMLAPGLKAVLPEFEAGEFKPVLKALDDLWMVFEIHEAVGSSGSVFTINAEWWLSLGPRIKDRAKKLILDIKTLRRRIVSLQEKGGEVTRDELTLFGRIIFEAGWLEGIIPQAEGMPHGDFTVVPLKGVSQKEIDSCLSALDKAASVIRPRFPSVLYGKVYLNTTVGKGFRAVALYSPDHDNLALSTRTSSTVGDVHAICHELGHRFFTKFWTDKGQKDEFMRLSTEPKYGTIEFDKPTRGKLADEFIENAETGKTGPPSDLLASWIGYLKTRPEVLREVQTLARKFTQDKTDEVGEKLWVALALPDEGTIQVQSAGVVRPPIAVTPYGAKSWTENFAEAFALYVMGKQLPPEIAAIMDRL